MQQLTSLLCSLYKVIRRQWQQLDARFKIHRQRSCICSSRQFLQVQDLFYFSANSVSGNESSSQMVEQKPFHFTNQPEEDDDGDDDEDDEDEGEGLWVSHPPRSVNLTDDDVTSFSFSFLLPVQTDLWAGLNCHVTFFVVDDCSTDVAGFIGILTD